MHKKKIQKHVMGNLNYELIILPLWDMLDDYYVTIDHEKQLQITSIKNS